ncbi:periplasmic heavy metal sensor [Maribellus sp. YY47]|uniref:Spy/CpxP family protein refolding chaperone n=1 Tax=Maribellus sp. YY47 TaxID=2929486 RepID=UPI00200190FF|nr:periplasmic heavy metal sensor [Maribellus sp. YY47]MCK3683763.1 periplasmic heavy metal sensor [Maribellus sp. YY47]
MKIRFLTLTLITVFAVTSMALAQNPETKKGDREPREAFMPRNERFADRMNHFFTEEQQEQMKTIRLETAKKVKPLRNELGELEARQQTLTTAEKADLDAIYQNIDKMSEVKAEIQKIMAKQHQQIRSLLTEEQLLKFDAMKGWMTDHRNNGFRGEKAPRPNAG